MPSHSRRAQADRDEPTVLNTAQMGTRAVLNALPTIREDVAPISTVFVGPGSAVCSKPNVITRQGFNLLPTGQCGGIAIRRGTP